MTWFTRFLAFALLLLAIAGCHKNTTTVPFVWRDPGFDETRFSTLFVIGEAENDAVRRLVEDRFVEAVSSKGVVAEASWERLPNSESLTDEEIADALGVGDFDGVLVTRLIGVERRAEYVRPPTYSSPSSSYGFTTSGYYATSYTRISGAGHYQTTTMYVIETNLYAWPTGELVWSGQSDTREQKSFDDTIEAMTAAVATQLKREKLIP